MDAYQRCRKYKTLGDMLKRYGYYFKKVKLEVVFVNEIFMNELLKNEEILWSGQPENTIFTTSDIFLIPFSLIWGGFAVFWEISTIIASAPFFFSLFGIPFVIMGFYLIFGRFIFKSIKKKHTYYAITNQRILILSNLRSSNLQAEFIRQIPCINKSVKSNGIGTIKFGNSPYLTGMYGNSGVEFFGNRYTNDIPVFYDIQDVEAVYKLINEIRQDI